MKQSTKKNAGAPCQSAPAKQSTCSNCTTCHCGKQATQPALFEIPPPALVGGSLVDYLEAHPDWWGRPYLLATLGESDRGLRLQAEHSGGAVIFSSLIGGLKATRHANPAERRACCAELRRRAYAHLRRADEIEAFPDGQGGFVCVRFLQNLTFALFILLLVLRAFGGGQ